MKSKINLFQIINMGLAVLLLLLGFSNCDPVDEYGVPNADYNLKGKVVDKAYAKPIKGIRIGYYGGFINQANMYKVSRNPNVRFNADTTDIKGEYNFTQNSAIIPEGEIQVYVRDIDGNENGLYRDTVINANFENAVKSGKTRNWYGGKLTLNVDIELTKKIEGIE